MYLTKIHLHNFQSHKDTVITLNAGFICIAGKTRSGKSSILRALNFMFNDVWSDSFIRTGETSVTVTITLDNGVVISRQKGNGKNIINVTDTSGTVEKFENFGIAAPVKVKQLLGVFPLKIDTDYAENINIHMQDDTHFLLMKSAPVKTKFINRMTQLHILDAANRTLTTDQLSSKKILVQLNSDKDTLAAILQTYTNIEIDKQQVKLNLNKIDAAIKALEKLQKQFDACYVLATKTAAYLKLKMLYTKREKIILKISGLKSVYTQYTNYKNLFNNIQKYEALMCKMKLQESLIKEYNNILSMKKNITEAMNVLAAVNAYIEKERTLQQATETLQVMVQKLPVCPTCGRAKGEVHDC